MRKVGQTRWLVLALATGLFGLAVLMGGGTSFFGWHITAVQAASKDKNQHQSNCTGGHQLPSLGGTVVIDTDEVICNNLTSFGSTVAINGEVTGDVLAFGSNVLVGTGTVDGDIDIYGGSVTLQNGAHIHGYIQLYGGSLIPGTATLPDGKVIDHTKRVDLFFFLAGKFAFPLWQLPTWIALGLLLTWLLPEHVTLVRTTMANKIRRSFMLGLLTLLLAVPLVIVLVSLILSIPLAIIVVVGLIVAWALGTVAMGWLFGEQVVHAIAPHQNSRPLQVVIGLTVLTLLGALPYVGWLISIGVGVLGLGAVFLSRFGTRLYGQPKRPLPL